MSSGQRLKLNSDVKANLDFNAFYAFSITFLVSYYLKFNENSQEYGTRFPKVRSITTMRYTDVWYNTRTL